MNVVVIGAGVIGATVAYRLARAGAAVTLLEAGRVGGGTSSATFAWTNSNGKTPRSYHDLNVAGMRAHAALRNEFDGLPWWHEGGNLEWATDDAGRTALHTKVERLRSWGYAAERLNPQQIIELEPDVDRGAVADALIAYYPDEGWVDTVPYVHAMVQAALRLGAQVRERARVTSLQVSRGRVTGVRTAGGEAYGADVVVNCAGPEADEMAGLAGWRLPLHRRPGLLIVTPPVPTSLRRIVHSPECSIRPDGGGRVMLHADPLDEDIRPDEAIGPSAPLVKEVIRLAAIVFPTLAGTAAEATRLGIRPIPKDGFPIVGPVPDVEGYYIVVTHSGVTLAPILGQAVAHELVQGRTEPMLESFRPNRFAG